MGMSNGSLQYSPTTWFSGQTVEARLVQPATPSTGLNV